MASDLYPASRKKQMDGQASVFTVDLMFKKQFVITPHEMSFERYDLCGCHALLGLQEQMLSPSFSDLRRLKH